VQLIFMYIDRFSLKSLPKSRSLRISQRKVYANSFQCTNITEGGGKDRLKYKFSAFTCCSYRGSSILDRNVDSIKSNNPNGRQI
jgi:hypothetical protein